MVADTAQFQENRFASPAWRVGGAVWLVLTRIGALFVLLQTYTILRKTFFQRPPEVAFDHALDLIALQEALRIDVELALQHRVLEHQWLVEFFNAYYRQFKPALYVCAALALLLAPAAFGRIARAFVLATLIALPCYALYPLAPPRFMRQYGYPFVDTLAVYSPTPPSSGGLGGANQFAAMPSMHIGWTAVGVLWLAAALPWRRIGPVLAALHLALMCVTVVVTGNHYVLDIVAGFAVAGAALGLARLLPRELPWADFGCRMSDARRVRGPARPVLAPDPGGGGDAVGLPGRRGGRGREGGAAGGRLTTGDGARAAPDGPVPLPGRRCRPT